LRSDRAASDIDVLIVGDDLTLEGVDAVLAPAERQLGRTVSPTLYTRAEFERCRIVSNAFIARVLAGEHVMLIGEEPDDAGAAG
jgi:hypothetical protein